MYHLVYCVLARQLRHEYLGLEDLQDNREYRHAAYRQFVLWQHGERITGLSSPAVACGAYDYTGFIPGLL